MKAINKIIIGLTLSSNLMSPVVSAEAYIPKDDAEVLERLPVALSERNHLQSLKGKIEANPDNYPLVLELARDYVSIGRNLSDPRYYGYAESVLMPWLQNASAKPDAWVLMATILQNRHDFQTALAKLNMALSLNPRHLQAWLTKAAIHEAQGDYSAALRSCLGLVRLSGSLSAVTCLNSALSLSGQAEYAYGQLSLAVAEAEAQPEELTWAYTILAEMSERLDKRKDAENWYRKALATGFRSVYLLTCYADFLLDQGRADDVIKLIGTDTQADVLLLRQALAEQVLQSGNFAGHAELIQTRIAAAQARGDTVHQGDEARFNLHILKNAQAALALAQSNWAVQKEPRDARILLEAAVAAKQPDAALPVLEFIKRTRLEDKRLLAYITALKG